MAFGEIRLRDWWRVIRRELAAGLVLGAILGVIGISRIMLWHTLRGTYGPHYLVVALTIGCSLVGVVMFGTTAGSMLPFLLRRCGLDPASASAPFVATLVDVTGLIIYFSVASVILRGISALARLEAVRTTRKEGRSGAGSRRLESHDLSEPGAAGLQTHRREIPRHTSRPTDCELFLELEPVHESEDY